MPLVVYYRKPWSLKDIKLSEGTLIIKKHWTRFYSLDIFVVFYQWANLDLKVLTEFSGVPTSLRHTVSIWSDFSVSNLVYIGCSIVRTLPICLYEDLIRTPWRSSLTNLPNVSFIVDQSVYHLRKSWSWGQTFTKKVGSKYGRRWWRVGGR